MNIKLTNAENTELNEVKARVASLPVGVYTRTTKKIGQYLLLENEGIIAGGNVHFFTIKNVGLGIIQVAKAPLNIRDNVMVK